MTFFIQNAAKGKNKQILIYALKGFGGVQKDLME